MCFGCCSSAAFGALLCHRPLAGVAIHSTVSGVLGRRGFALESAAARVCREAAGRATLNVQVCDLDLPPRGAVDKRLGLLLRWLPKFPLLMRLKHRIV